MTNQLGIKNLTVRTSDVESYVLWKAKPYKIIINLDREMTNTEAVVFEQHRLANIGLGIFQFRILDPQSIELVDADDAAVLDDLHQIDSAVTQIHREALSVEKSIADGARDARDRLKRQDRIPVVQ